ncbi:MAG: hypothetical protein HY814_11955 [Candidatus Riflebacteria bacterium]|nr:hypothetical protein [Candidatus Riflebacteria bacterium]
MINLAPDTSPLVSKGWYGLARCYMSQGNQELAKASLEEVLSRNNDPESVNASRDVYKSLKGQADLSVPQVQQTVLYLQWRYQSIPFFSFISKFLAWRDLKSAEKQLEGAQVLANTFNPRYLIAPVQAPAASVLSADGTTVLSATYIPAPSELGTATQGSTISPVTTGSLQPATQPLGNIMSTGPAANAIAPTAGSAPASTPAAPVDDLKAKQEAYLAAYRKLQAAMAANDAAAIQAATKAFQSAMKAYNAARSAVTAP